MAQPLDLGQLELRGDPIPVAEQVALDDPSWGSGAFSVSEAAMLAYQTGAADTGSRLVWFDRTGKQIGVLGGPEHYGDLELSPDGTRAAVTVADSAKRTSDLWVYDTARSVRTRFTFDPGNELAPIWSPDGSRLVFSGKAGALGGVGGLRQKASTGGGNEEELIWRPMAC